MPRLPRQDDLRRLAGRLPSREQVDRLKKRLPGKADLDRVRERMPTRDDLTRLKDKAPDAGEVRRRIQSSPVWRVLRPLGVLLWTLFEYLLQAIAWLVGRIPRRVRLGVSAVLMVWLVGSWWFATPRTPAADDAEPAVVEVQPKRPAPQPVMLGALVPPAQPKYEIASGLYRQANAGGSKRFLDVAGPGRGQLVLHFTGIEKHVVGAPKVVIDTTWRVDEPNDEVTFTLHRGAPRASYKAVLNFALDRVTRFHIDRFSEDSLVLRRVRDGEVFHWERFSAAHALR